jgi:hypothetical protein
MRQSLSSRHRINPFLRPRLRLAVVGIVLAVVVLGGLGQAGLITPKVEVGQSQSSDGTFSWTSVQNVSWRSWKFSDPHVVDVKPAHGVWKAGTTRVALLVSQPAQLARYGAGVVSSLEVVPGRTFYVEALTTLPACDKEGSSSPRVTVNMDVATPLGKRTVSASFLIACE